MGGQVGGRAGGVRLDVNEELKFCENSKKVGGSGWGGRVGGSGWGQGRCNREVKFL